MTHTPEQLKELAEFVAKYLELERQESGEKFIRPNAIGWSEWGRKNKKITQDCYFHVFMQNHLSAPILMHLAQEKMEKEGFDCEYNQQVGIHLWEFNMSLDYDRPVARAENKNKFIAFWEAVQEAKGGK